MALALVAVTPKIEVRSPPLRIVIRVKDVRTHEVLQTHVVSYTKRISRDWLARLLYWAWKNHKYVELINEDDVDIKVSS